MHPDTPQQSAAPYTWMSPEHQRQIIKRAAKEKSAASQKPAEPRLVIGEPVLNWDF